jgi:ABC-type bacteriocin/lantibiotic exporter with double-glycine peptidase domain
MMDSYMQRGYVFFIDSSLGSLLRGMQSSISNTYNGLNTFFKIVSELLTLAFICIYIILTDWMMALCVIALSAFCLLAIVLGFQKTVRKASQTAFVLSGNGNRILVQAFQGIKEVLVMKREQYFVKEYRKNYTKQQKASIKQTMAVSSPTYIIEAVCITGLMIAVCIKAITTEDSVTLVAQLGAFAVAAFRILPSLGRISSYFNQFMACVPGINETYENFKKAREAVARKKEKYQEVYYGDITFNDRLRVDHVTWTYPHSDQVVLNDLCLDIQKGQSIAFVGKSGAGKTTLADVILGLLIPQEGHIYLDGVDVQTIQGNWHKVIGFVPQSVNLQDDTVRRNVAFGLDDSEIDDERVWKALEEAQMKDVIENAREGLDTMIGERGIRFSGGQKQRFAIARALYYNPDILVLDEATAALDTETEQAVMDSIQMLSGSKTLIIIAHRITTIRQCDKIYRIEGGKAVEVKYEDLT